MEVRRWRSRPHSGACSPALWILSPNAGKQALLGGVFREYLVLQATNRGDPNVDRNLNIEGSRFGGAIVVLVHVPPVLYSIIFAGEHWRVPGTFKELDSWGLDQ
jgi:hypothetical protein